MLWNALGNRHAEGYLGLDGLLDTGGSEGRGDKDAGGRRAGFLDGVADVGEDGEAEVFAAGFLRVCSADDLGS
jgi:hypothetical protein